MFAHQSSGVSPGDGIMTGDEHEQVDGTAFADERRRERAGRLRDDDQVGAVADRVDDGVRVLRQPCRVVVAGEVRRDGVVASFAQRVLDEVPVPADVAGAVDQHIRRHVLTPKPCIASGSSL